jgi:hypothetical protein
LKEEKRGEAWKERGGKRRNKGEKRDERRVGREEGIEERRHWRGREEC